MQLTFNNSRDNCVGVNFLKKIIVVVIILLLHKKPKSVLALTSVTFV